MFIGVPTEIKNHEYRVGLTPDSVRELSAHGGVAIVLTKPHHTGERILIRIRPKTQAARRNPPFRANAGRLNHHQSNTAHRELAQVHQVPVGRAALIGAILTHGSNRDSVAQLNSTQGDRRKQV